MAGVVVVICPSVSPESIPAELRGMTALQAVALDGNKLTGEWRSKYKAMDRCPS